MYKFFPSMFGMKIWISRAEIPKNCGNVLDFVHTFVSVKSGWLVFEISSIWRIFWNWLRQLSFEIEIHNGKGRGDEIRTLTSCVDIRRCPNLGEETHAIENYCSTIENNWNPVDYKSFFTPEFVMEVGRSSKNHPPLYPVMEARTIENNSGTIEAH